MFLLDHDRVVWFKTHYHLRSVDPVSGLCFPEGGEQISIHQYHAGQKDSQKWIRQTEKQKRICTMSVVYTC